MGNNFTDIMDEATCRESTLNSQNKCSAIQ